jgi:hypothetical protein
MGDYKPEYAKGEVLVHFLDCINVNDDFVRTVVELVGYKLKDENYELGDLYIILVEPGEEEKACEGLKTLRIKSQNLVDWADRRDLKFEKRSRELDELVDMTQSLNDDPEQGDADYNKSLDEIINYASSLKEKKE